MGCELDFLDKRLSRLFFRLGHIVASHPSHFVTIPLLLAALMSTGFQRLHHISDIEYLFAPANSPSHADREMFREYFPMKTAGRFQPDRITDATRFGQILVFARDGGNIFRSEVFGEALQLDALVRNISVEFFGESKHYDDICARWQNDCFSNDVLKLQDIIPDIESGAMNLTWPFFFHPETFDTIIFPGFVGSPELVDDETVMMSSPAINLYYFVEMDTVVSKSRGDLWEKKFRELMPQIKERLRHIDVYWYTSLTNDTELVSTILVVIPYFAVTVIIMIIFSTVTSMMRDWVLSKPILGVVGVVSACISTAAAFGLIMYLGVEFTGLVMAAPFLMLGIGMDNTFVMMAGWRKTNVLDSVPRRLAHTYAEAAVSITITSGTNCLSFMIGIYTPFRAVQVFCMYTALAVFMIYIYHITFFGACLAMTGYWEEENRHCLTLKKVLPLAEAGEMGGMYKWFCAGGISRTSKPDIEHTKHALMSFFKTQMAKFLCIPAIKALILMTFLAYLAVGGWGISQLDEGLQAKRLSMDDSYYVEYFDKSTEYFHGYPLRIMVGIVGEDVAYWEPTVQKEIESLMKDIENHTLFGDALFTESWLRGFLQFVEVNRDYIEIDISNKTSFMKNLRDVYLVGDDNPSSLDVAFNENQTEIMASRFIVQVVNLPDLNQVQKPMLALREIAKKYPQFNIISYHPQFVFAENFVLVRGTTIQTVTIAAVLMLIVALIMIPAPMCAIWVGFSILSIEVGILGYMTFWGVSLDTISMICLIMCIGFSVDFSAHISYSFMASDGATAEEKLADALEKVGMPIVQGSISSIFGVIVLGFIPAYLFRTFFKTVFMVMFFGALHGLLLLPVLLTIFGNLWVPRLSKDNFDDEDDIEYGSRRRSSAMTSVSTQKFGRQLSITSYPTTLQPWPATGTKGGFPMRPSISLGGKRSIFPQLPPPDEWMETVPPFVTSTHGKSNKSKRSKNNAPEVTINTDRNGDKKRDRSRSKSKSRKNEAKDGASGANGNTKTNKSHKGDKRGSTAALQHSPSTSESSLHLMGGSPGRDDRRRASSTPPVTGVAPALKPGLGKYLADRRRESQSTYENASYIRDPTNDYY